MAFKGLPLSLVLGPFQTSDNSEQYVTRLFHIAILLRIQEIDGLGGEIFLVFCFNDSQELPKTLGQYQSLQITTMTGGPANWVYLDLIGLCMH